MIVQHLHIDDGLAGQTRLSGQTPLNSHDLRDWGARIRLACRFARFRQFEKSLADVLSTSGTECVTLYGSGDFHHVTLALLHRITQPFNLLVLDNHPDWMRWVPFLHCGTWLYHAARLPAIQRIFHAGGDVDFDNGFRRLAPRSMLLERKIIVFPAIRRFQASFWRSVPQKPLRPCPEMPVTEQRIASLLAPFADDLGRFPLYISVDKDVINVADAVVNWDSGHLSLSEATAVVRAFVHAAGGKLAGADLLGDWSPVRLSGVLPRLMHWTEHPRLDIDAGEAASRNEIANLALLDALNISA
ncbi:MAG: arginase family protein [Planctomycetes bacterium]|nr:arginase family protein [Planctomycetota bacterium]